MRGSDSLHNAPRTNASCSTVGFDRAKRLITMRPIAKPMNPETCSTTSVVIPNHLIPEGFLVGQRIRRMCAGVATSNNVGCPPSGRTVAISSSAGPYVWTEAADAAREAQAGQRSRFDPTRCRCSPQSGVSHVAFLEDGPGGPSQSATDLRRRPSLRQGGSRDPAPGGR
jgi:hypothetical protein